MRKPSEYLPAAMAGLRGRLMPDCSEVLVYCGRAATVTRVGSPSRGEDALAGSSIVEEMRVLASASDFPTLSKGNVVLLGNASRLVSSVRSDPAGVTLIVGLSPKTTPVAFYGERKDGRKIALTIECLIVEDSALTVADTAAPVHTRAFTVRLPRSAWPDAKPPEIGEWMDIEWRGQWLWTRANSVNHMTSGDIIVSAIQTQEETGGPPWLA